MPFGEELRNALSPLAPVYPDEAPPEADLPFFTYAREAQAYEYGVSTVDMRGIGFTVQAWANGRDAATALADAAEDALLSYRSAEVTEFRLEGRNDLAAFPPFSETLKGCELVCLCQTRGK